MTGQPMLTLVTGAAGLLGSHVVDVLSTRGERPRVLIRPGESLPEQMRTRVDICVGDVCDRKNVERSVRDVGQVIHCAARTGPWGPAAAYAATNVRALHTLVDASLAAGVLRFVHVSSVTVHGNDLRGAADETAPLRGEPNPYSRSKVAGERLLQAMIRERAAPITIVRPGWVYGPRDTASFGRFATMILQRRMVMIGSGNNHLPLIYARDAAQGAVLASEAPAGVGNAYLLVNDEPVTQRDFLSAIAAELGVPPPSRRLPYRVALLLGAAAETAAHVARRVEPPPLMRYGVQLLGGENRYSIARARQELGFSPQVTMSEGVRRSVEWFNNRPQAAAA